MLATILLVVLLLGTLACSWYQPKPVKPLPPSPPNPPKAPYAFGIVVLDEQGWISDRQQLNDVLNLVEHEADRGGALIVAYIHGWHHNADPADHDLLKFQDMLAHLARKVADEPKAGLLDVLPAHAGPVVGVYIGWRGTALPMPLDYATFWERKAASQRVGHAEVGEILAGLHRIYRAHNSPDKITNLVVIGHSFGGSVLFSATSDVFKQRLAARLRDAKKRAALVPISATPASLTFQQPATGEVMEGVGDLVILVNPAIEASQYEPIAALATNQDYPPEQHPVLLTVSAENDWPRNNLFSPGRWFSTLSQPKPDKAQAEQMRTAMGNYVPQITHCLKIIDGSSCRRTPNLPPCDPDAANAKDITPSGLLPGAPQAFRDTTAPPTQLCPVSHTIKSTNPFLVAQTTPGIIDGHNGQFSDAFRDFLVNFIARTRTKRAMVRSEAKQRLQEQRPTPEH
jgi:hypothetical protein